MESILELNPLIDAISPNLRKTVKFNPSISNIRNNFYLLSIRGFLRYPWLEVPSQNKIASTLHNPNHPWLGGVGGLDGTWWQPVEGYDTTFLFLIKITLKNGNPFVTFLRTYDKTIKGVDTRLFKSEDNMIYATYNVGIVDPNIKPGRASETCKDLCHLIEGVIISFNENMDIDIRSFTDKKGYKVIFCLNQSQRIEKNWSLWKRYPADHMDIDSEFVISYNLVPYHSVLVGGLSGNRIGECNFINAENPSTFLNDLIAYYNDTLKISLSTPALDVSDVFEENSMLALGHMKVFYRDLIQIENYETTPLGRVINDLLSRQVLLHPQLIYFMFYYVFNRETLEIERLSISFIPYCKKYALAFPSGLSRIENIFIIAFGDSDIASNLIFVHKNDLIRNINFISSFKPSTYVFKCAHR